MLRKFQIWARRRVGLGPLGQSVQARQIGIACLGEIGPIRLNLIRDLPVCIRVGAAEKSCGWQSAEDKWDFRLVTRSSFAGDRRIKLELIGRTAMGATPYGFCLGSAAMTGVSGNLRACSS